MKSYTDEFVGMFSLYRLLIDFSSDAIVYLFLFTSEVHTIPIHFAKPEVLVLSCKHLFEIIFTEKMKVRIHE